MTLIRLAARRLLPALACAFAGFAGHAQQLPTILVTGSVVPRTHGSEFAATSVLTRDDLERAGVRDLVSALDLLGTAQVEQQGGPGTAAFVRLRGADSRDTLVLVDGVLLNDVTLGIASLAQIPVASIERIEVARGNLSALYGANATGGVIQIFTRRGTQDLNAQASVVAGSRGTRGFDASISGSITGALRARASAGAERTDGYSAIDPAALPAANPDLDANRRRHAMLAADLDLSNRHALGLDLRVVRGIVQYDNGASFSAPIDTHAQYLLQRGATLRGRHAVAPAWTLSWHAADARETRRESSVTGFGPFVAANAVRNRSAVVEANGTLASRWRVQFGAERLSQTTDSPDYLTDRRRTDVLRAGIVHEAPWGSVQAALRRDRISDFGSARTGLLGASWRFAPEWSAHAMLGNSFTPPTLDMLFYAFCCSNPNLRPELSRNADVAVQWERGATSVRATVFAARQRDKIVNDADFIPHNVARARNQGVELAARTRRGAWRFAGEATLHDPVDADTGQRLLRRTDRQLGLRTHYDGAGWTAGAALRHVGRRPDIDATELPSYSVVDLSASWQATPAWSLQVTLENAFDRDYQPTLGYQGRPRGVFVTLGWRGGR